MLKCRYAIVLRAPCPVPAAAGPVRDSGGGLGFLLGPRTLGQHGEQAGAAFLA